MVTKNNFDLSDFSKDYLNFFKNRLNPEIKIKNVVLTTNTIEDVIEISFEEPIQPEMIVRNYVDYLSREYNLSSKNQELYQKLRDSYNFSKNVPIGFKFVPSTYKMFKENCKTVLTAEHFLVYHLDPVYNKENDISKIFLELNDKNKVRSVTIHSLLSMTNREKVIEQYAKLLYSTIDKE